MGVIQKKGNDKTDKKKNKVKDNIKSRLETNTKFPKVKNAEKSTGPIQNGVPKKKFEKNLKKGDPPGSPKIKQEGKINKSPKQKKKKNKKNKVLKPKSDKPANIADTPPTAEETKTAVKTAKSVKKDGVRINKLLTEILETADTTKQPKHESKPIAAGLQLEELISKAKLKNHVKNFMQIVKYTKSQPDYKTKLLNDKRLITLSVLAMKIPDCPNKNSKIKLPVPLFTAESEICLFVADLERGRKRDPEPFVRHYEEILEKNGVTCVNKIITISHLINEYSTYELKFRLANTFDVFLVEGKISNRVGKFVGKIFADIKRNPVVIKDFTQEAIDSALTMITYRQSGLGPVNVFNFAYDTMTESEITENLYSLIQQLKTIYPGGWTNIKSLSLTALKEVTYPIMFNFVSPNDIPVPNIKNDRDVKIEKAKTLLDSALQKVEITLDGVLVKKKSKRKFVGNDESSNSETEEQDNSPPKAKKKIAKIKQEPITKNEPEPEVVPVITTKKDKKKNKKNKPILVVKEEQESIVETPEPVELVKKQKNKKNKQSKTANFKETEKSAVTNKKSAQNVKFEKSTDGVKPKKKKMIKTN